MHWRLYDIELGRTRSEHPVEELSPACGVVVRRLQVALT